MQLRFAAREVRWRKLAATKPSVSTWKTPPAPRRVKRRGPAGNRACSHRAFVRGDDGCAELFVAGSPQHRDALRGLCRIADYAEYER